MLHELEIKRVTDTVKLNTRTFQKLLFGFQGLKSEISLINNIIISFTILINKLTQQNGTNKVPHKQRMQWLRQL